MRVRLAELQNENTVKTVVMWTWASVSQTFTFPYFLSNGRSCTYRTAILCGLMQGTQFLCNRLINSRIALVIQTTPTIVTSSVVSDTQYSDVQWSMKHLRNANIIGLTWTKKNPFNHITCSLFCLDTASGTRMRQQRPLLWCCSVFYEGWFFVSEV